MCAVEIEAAMVVSGNEAEMEDDGVFCSASMGMCGRRFVRGVGVVVVGVPVCSPLWHPLSGWRGWWPGRSNRPIQMVLLLH